MLGINDPVIYLGYLLAILSLIACVVYGILNWNKGAEDDPKPQNTSADWIEKEEQIQRDL